MNDNYKYGFQEFYDIALDDLYNYVMICLQQNGDLHKILEGYIVRDFGDFHVVLENKDICETVFEVVRDIDKKGTR